MRHIFDSAKTYMVETQRDETIEGTKPRKSRDIGEFAELGSQSHDLCGNDCADRNVGWGTQSIQLKK